jgi:hypothetical protein
MKTILHACVCTKVFVLALTILPSCTVDHDSAFDQKGLLTAKADELKQTQIAATLNTPIKAGQNVLWCGTFQLAWNEVSSLLGEDQHFLNEPPLVVDLNRKAFTRADLDDASYIAMAGFVRDGIYEKIPKALQGKFHGLARPHYLPKPDAADSPNDIIAYSYLFKNLQFAKPFERIDGGLNFQGTQVECFGVNSHKPGHAAIRRQVSILDYVSPDDFVVELATKSDGDRVILAKVKPQETLEKTVQAVGSRVSSARPQQMGNDDVLKVPKLNFDLTRKYQELIGLILAVKNPRAYDLRITEAMQNIRFQMNEKGVVLRSEALIQYKSGSVSVDSRRMILDQPYLIMLQMKGDKTPYFVLWVDNPELLIKVMK